MPTLEKFAHISLRLPKDLKAQLDRKSLQADRSLSGTVRVALERYLASVDDI
jgi:predicted DNA-binding protein